MHRFENLDLFLRWYRKTFGDFFQVQNANIVIQLFVEDSEEERVRLIDYLWGNATERELRSSRKLFPDATPINWKIAEQLLLMWFASYSDFFSIDGMKDKIYCSEDCFHPQEGYYLFTYHSSAVGIVEFRVFLNGKVQDVSNYLIEFLTYWKKPIPPQQIRNLLTIEKADD